MTPISRFQSLSSNEDDVDQVTNEEESEGGELEQTQSRVSQVESVSSKHAQEHTEEQSSVEVIVVGPLALHLLDECVVTTS